MTTFDNFVLVGIDEGLLLLREIAPKHKHAAVVPLRHNADHFVGEYVPANFGMRACLMRPFNTESNKLKSFQQHRPAGATLTRQLEMCLTRTRLPWSTFEDIRRDAHQSQTLASRSSAQ